MKNILASLILVSALVIGACSGSGSSGIPTASTGTGTGTGTGTSSTFSSGCTNKTYPATSGSASVYGVGTGASAVANDTLTSRTYMSFVPAPVAGSVPGMILVFHGTIDPVGGNPPASGLEPIPAQGSPASNGMESNGHFVIVYFNAEVHNDADTAYIYGYNSPGVRAWDQRNPALNSDIGYIRSVYSSVEKNFCFDTAKVFAYGFSSGGFFATNLANFQPISGITLKGAGIDHGGLIQGANFVNTSAPQATGAKKVFLNTNLTDSVVTSAMTIQAQNFWIAGGASTNLVYTGTGHTPMDNATLGQMAGFFRQ